MIVIDTSAVVAMILRESTAPALYARLANDLDRVMSVVSYLEAGTVLAGRQQKDKLRAITHLDAFLEEAGIVLAAADEIQARHAMRARIVYGRGMGHGGTLNLGDTFAYALAKVHRAPLLFVGNDFSTTDVTPALNA